MRGDLVHSFGLKKIQVDYLSQKPLKSNDEYFKTNAWRFMRWTTCKASKIKCIYFSELFKIKTFLRQNFSTVPKIFARIWSFDFWIIEQREWV